MGRSDRFAKLPLDRLPSPCYIIDERSIEENCMILDSVQKRTGCKVLLALKGFSITSLFPVIRKYLHGTSASGLYEARLGKESFGKEVHVFAPAYDDREFAQLMRISDHIVFNSLAQWNHFRPLVQKSRRRISCGIRINPEYSEVSRDLWNPCSRYSRFGVTADDLKAIPEGIEGLHFHALCQQNSDALERMIRVVEKKFGKHLAQVKWVNFGGGQLITAPNYDVDRLCRLISGFRGEHGIEIYMEPGEAVALDAGVLLSTVLDTVRNEIDIAILDTSAWAHVQEILSASYKLDVIGAKKPGELRHTYRLASRSCLSGDVIGDYSFSHKLKRGSKLMFRDLASYAVVSNNVFNGIPLPATAVLRKSGKVSIIHRPGYEDYISRL